MSAINNGMGMSNRMGMSNGMGMSNRMGMSNGMGMMSHMSTKNKIKKLQSELGLEIDPIQKEIVKEFKNSKRQNKDHPKKFLYNLAKKCLHDHKFMEICSKRKDDVSQMILKEYNYDLDRYEYNFLIKHGEKKKIQYSSILKEFLESGVDYTKWGYQDYMLREALNKNIDIIKNFIYNSNNYYDVILILLKLYNSEQDDEIKYIIESELTTTFKINPASLKIPILNQSHTRLM